MARPLRIAYPAALYHVTARGNERRPIFRDARARERFCEREATVASRYRLVVHAYVLMRNHVLTQVSPAAKMPRELLLQPRGGRSAWPRPVAMYLAWEFCG